MSSIYLLFIEIYLIYFLIRHLPIYQSICCLFIVSIYLSTYIRIYQPIYLLIRLYFLPNIHILYLIIQLTHFTDPILDSVGDPRDPAIEGDKTLGRAQLQRFQACSGMSRWTEK